MLPLLVGCVEARYGDGPSGSPPPGGDIRVLEAQSGDGSLAQPGDRIVVDLVGRYGSGEVWGEGPLTIIAGALTYPGLNRMPREGDIIRMEYWTSPHEKLSRLVQFAGGDPDEVYQVRHDRGPILVEHTVRKVCRPRKLFLVNTGYGPIEFGLGCWPRFRRGGGSYDDLSREDAAAAAWRFEPPSDVRPAPDSTRFLGPDALHLAVREARPGLVADLLGTGYNVGAADSLGFLPIHYVGWAQRPPERFVRALEEEYLAVLDTLLAYGAEVDATVREGRQQGQTALSFVVDGCADPFVARLLDAGADPNVEDGTSSVLIARAARTGCPETLRLLLAAGAEVDADPLGSGTPLEHLGAVSAFHQGHLAVAELLVGAGARRDEAVSRLERRLEDRGPGPFGFYGRPMARRVLDVLRVGA